MSTAADLRTRLDIRPPIAVNALRNTRCSLNATRVIIPEVAQSSPDGKRLNIRFSVDHKITFEPRGLLSVYGLGDVATELFHVLIGARLLERTE
jgi:hypothetical protein